ncbi:MAG TPA: hypothetical protein VKZ49_14840 [Polyangiaceae bacterium]|nr:hypothetical protein [Polyangiaceae bacterium]
MHARCWLRCLGASMAVSVAVLSSHIARADAQHTAASQEERARALVREGIGHYDQQRWQAAYESFLAASRIKLHHSILANLAYAELELGKYKDAAEHLRAYLSLAPTEEVNERAEAEKKLLQARQQLVTLGVSVNLDGADLFLDGAHVGRSPLGQQLFMDPGQAVLEARAPGQKTAKQLVTGRGGDRRVVSLTLALAPSTADDPPSPTSRSAAAPARPAPAPFTTPPPPESKSPTGRAAVLYSGAALTAVSAGLGVFFMVKSERAADREDELRDRIDRASGAGRGACTAPSDHLSSLCADLRANNDERADAASAARLSFLIAAGLGAATAVTYLVWPRSSAPATGVWLTPTGGGIVFEGAL